MALYAASKRVSGLMVVARASVRLRCAAARRCAISSASAGCSLSCPILSKFCKLIRSSQEEYLRLARNPGNEAIFGSQLRAESVDRHDRRIDLALQAIARGCE